MELQAVYTFDAPVSRVWDALMDIEAIGRCLPGCGGLRPVGDDRYEAELVAAVAAVSGSFKATVAIEDRQPPHTYRLVTEATGRPGFVRGHARMSLAPDGSGTRVEVNASADVGGTIARVGQRLLEGVARMMLDRFFACMASRIGRSGG